MSFATYNYVAQCFLILCSVHYARLGVMVIFVIPASILACPMVHGPQMPIMAQILPQVVCLGAVKDSVVLCCAVLKVSNSTQYERHNRPNISGILGLLMVNKAVRGLLGLEY